MTPEGLSEVFEDILKLQKFRPIWTLKVYLLTMVLPFLLISFHLVSSHLISLIHSFIQF